MGHYSVRVAGFSGEPDDLEAAVKTALESIPQVDPNSITVKGRDVKFASLPGMKVSGVEATKKLKDAGIGVAKPAAKAKRAPKK